MFGDIARILISVSDNRNNIVPTCDFVVLEPIVERLRDARAEFLNIVDRIYERGDRISDVDHDDLPVCLAAVVGRYTAQNLGLADLAKVTWVLADVEEVDGVVVARFVDEGMADVGIFPGLGNLLSCCQSWPVCCVLESTRLGNTHRPINKRIAPMRPYTLNEPRRVITVVVENWRQRLATLELDLAVCPAWNFNYSIDDGRIVFVRVQGDVVPEGDGVAFVQEPDSPVEGVASADFSQADGVVVEFAIVWAGVGTRGVVAFVRRTGRLWWLGYHFVLGNFGWARRWSSVYCSSQSGDENSTRRVHFRRVN